MVKRRLVDSVYPRNIENIQTGAEKIENPGPTLQP